MFDDTPGQSRLGLSTTQAASRVHLGVLYTMGAKSAATQEPNQERGIALHAATGPVKVESQSGKSALVAEKKVTIANMQKEVRRRALSF